MAQHIKQLLKTVMNRTTRLSSTTLKAALFSWILLHLIKTQKSTVWIDRLKADKLVKTTDSGKLFHTFTTLQAKKCALTLLYSLYTCRLVNETENSKKSDTFNLTRPLLNSS